MKINYENDLRLSILNVAELCYVNDIKPEGYRYTATCPFCGAKSGHFYLTPIDRENPNFKNVYRCVKCGSSGSSIHLYAELHNCSNKQAFKELMGFEVKQDVIKKIKKVKEEIKKPVIPIADIDTRDKVYKKLISLLNTNCAHMIALKYRGLSERDIKTNGYVTLPNDWKLKKYLCSIIKDAGLPLKGIPGFYLDKYKNWTFWTPKEGGFLVPVRDLYGRIQGCQIRKNGEKIKKKYPWFSSGYMDGGCSSQGFFHVHWNSLHSSKKIVITEGPLKATVAGILSDTTFLAVPGVGSYRGCVEILRKINACQIFLAYDMDKFKNKYVLMHEKNFIRYLKENGFNPKISLWNRNYKGIDDYIKHLKDTNNINTTTIG
ncbi:MAG: DUF3854 domain-containing protein [Clostridium tyrobutyricum]|uniref:DUF3854 domain-containing protein n=1 Tax=Clostridium tyrobutyricum TaxID=1519 RepID=UPI00164DDE7C|nr:DUF3854 domain-containing protein [Clostridium tyrobutyricum]MCH4200128.1 DUF3854 domain-containing protein [Clostridium tyrobutyricum]MCH4238229.1 DUF3854 domain-containing protein [Clostridium tyrobutyricum]MCH4259330.1 DUF3854 domain-containing protein [Clostridium tyrobutyricum]